MANIVLNKRTSRKAAKTSKRPPVTHTITIIYVAAATPQWSYTIKPPQSKPNKAKLKRGDTLQWKSKSGDWMVFFKGSTPLEDGSGLGLASVSGASGGPPAGGIISQNAKPGDVFDYGVQLVLNNNGGTVIDDPQIIIESDGVNPRKKRQE